MGWGPDIVWIIAEGGLALQLETGVQQRCDGGRFDRVGPLALFSTSDLPQVF